VGDETSVKTEESCLVCKRRGNFRLWGGGSAHHGSLHSTFLFPASSILYSFGRLMDLGAQLDSYNVSATPAQADVIALGSDWLAASDDVREAFSLAVTDYLTKYLESAEGRDLHEKLAEFATSR